MEIASDTGSVQEDPYLQLDPSGLLKVTSRQQLTYTCQLNLFKFPFDEQNCSLEFSSLSYNRRSVRLETSGNGTVFTTLSKKLKMTEGEWTLMEMQETEDEASAPLWTKSRLQYTVLLKRKPFLYIINLILPLLFLLFLDLASFFISESRGEKLSFKVTVRLSIFVLLLNLQTILPSTEEAMPMLALYCVSIFSLVFLGVLESVLVSFLIELDESRRAQVDDRPKRPSEDPDEPEEHRPDDQNLLHLILDKVLLMLQQVQRERKEKRKPGCYRKVATLINVVFFAIYLTTIVVSLIALFLI